MNAAQKAQIKAQFETLKAYLVDGDESDVGKFQKSLVDFIQTLVDMI